jgi:hypothetical protein
MNSTLEEIKNFMLKVKSETNHLKTLGESIQTSIRQNQSYLSTLESLLEKVESKISEGEDEDESKESKRKRKAIVVTSPLTLISKATHLISIIQSVLLSSTQKKLDSNESMEETMDSYTSVEHAVEYITEAFEFLQNVFDCYNKEDTIGYPIKHAFTEVFKTLVNLHKFIMLASVVQSEGRKMIEKILDPNKTMKDCMWILKIMLEYTESPVFQFTEKDLLVATAGELSRENISLVKKLIAATEARNAKCKTSAENEPCVKDEEEKLTHLVKQCCKTYDVELLSVLHERYNITLRGGVLFTNLHLAFQPDLYNPKALEYVLWVIKHSNFYQKCFPSCESCETATINLSTASIFACFSLTSNNTALKALYELVVSMQTKCPELNFTKEIVNDCIASDRNDALKFALEHNFPVPSDVIEYCIAANAPKCLQVLNSFGMLRFSDEETVCKMVRLALKRGWFLCAKICSEWQDKESQLQRCDLEHVPLLFNGSSYNNWCPVQFLSEVDMSDPWWKTVLNHPRVRETLVKHCPPFVLKEIYTSMLRFKRDISIRANLPLECQVKYLNTFLELSKKENKFLQVTFIPKAENESEISYQIDPFKTTLVTKGFLFLELTNVGVIDLRKIKSVLVKPEMWMFDYLLRTLDCSTEVTVTLISNNSSCSYLKGKLVSTSPFLDFFTLYVNGEPRRVMLNADLKDISF